MDDRTPLKRSHRVVDLSQGIAGAYATKVLADAGADVVLVEPPGGSPLRRRSASGAAVDPDVGGVLFQYLACSKRSVAADPDDTTDLALVHDLLRSADAIVWSEESSLCRHPALSLDATRAIAPAATVVALSGFGLTGPWAGRPSNDFIWQSLAGSAWNHGSSDDTPIMFGGNLGDFALGTLGAYSLLVAKARADRSGAGELIDVSALEVLALTHTMFPISFLDHAKRPHRVGRASAIPSIHPTSDGWIGFWTTTGQQWLDFCTMIEKFEWLDDPSLGLMDNRALRSDELIDAIEKWTGERTTAEIIEFASLLRLPVAPIGNGETMPTFDHYVEREVYVKNPRSGFPQPDVWYRSSGAWRRPFEPSPLVGEHTDELRREIAAGAATTVARRTPSDDDTLPFEGLRIVDMTAFWAGPIISHPLAMLGAEVIHVEAVKRPDGIRMAATIPMSEEGWWETSPFFNGTNTCKLGLTLDLQTETGRALLKQLIAQADAVIENYSPRVMDQLGLSYDELRAIKPDIIVVRAPAFGITGPWRDRVGYAPTIDQASGLAWITGEPGGRPMLIGAASDALGGLHGSMALLLALEHRRRTGEGALVEAPQVGTALGFSGEQVAEFAANGVLLERIGNRSPGLAPQGVYRTADRPGSFPGADDDWVAISVEDDAQWRTLCSVLGIGDTDLDLAGRQREHDRIDAAISAAVRDCDAETLSAELAAAGVPACRVVPPHEAAEIEPLAAGGYFEHVTKQVAGDMRLPRFPLRSSRGPAVWNRRPAPGLGEHNQQILGGLLGLDDAAIEQLAADGVIGNSTSVNLGW